MANIISKKDEGAFLMLFNRNGYALNFTTNDFDIFTTDSIGVIICSTYRMSKGESLVAYLNEASDEDRTKLLADLFTYYEENMEYEFNKDCKDELWWGSSGSRYNERCAKLYEKRKAIINAIDDVSVVVPSTAEDLKEDWQWRTSFRGKTVRFREELLKEEIFTGLDECLVEIQQFEVDQKENLG